MTRRCADWSAPASWKFTTADTPECGADQTCLTHGGINGACTPHCDGAHPCPEGQLCDPVAGDLPDDVGLCGGP